MRRRKPNNRKIIPDLKYDSELVAYLINIVMKDGKKSVAQRIVYDAFASVKEATGEDELEVFQQALDNVKPQVEVKSRRVGGANYQVPVEVPAERQIGIALRWVVQFARGRKGKSMAASLSQEILDAFNSTGAAVKKRDDTHRMAQANKAFAHYRW
ncbi:MAG: 30S ribosomal protein S7 [Lentisphaeria bacterium]|nr:30S ribosomal protein S7 [Lentisphaeria bacterium]